MSFKIASITARIIALLDFISAVPYTFHFIYHFMNRKIFVTSKKKKNENHNVFGKSGLKSF